VGLAVAAGMRLRDTTPRRRVRRAAPAAKPAEVSATS